MELTALRQAHPGRLIEWHASTASTMLLAAQLADAGCASGSVAGADRQTSGVGRHGRAWHSEPESGLYFTVVLRLPLAPQDAPIVTLLLGLAVRAAIEAVAELEPDLRWPNDLLLAGRKCAGILVQLHAGALLAGIGINVNQTEFPQPLAAIATSLRLTSGFRQRREDLLAAVLEEIDRHLDVLLQQGKEPILQRFAAASSMISGLRVRVENGYDGALQGVTDGLDASGFLLLRRDDGQQTRVMAGGVRALDSSLE